MELPQNLKQLYRHWEFHTVEFQKDSHKKLQSKTQDIITSAFTDQHLFREISNFIHERISIWNKKTSGENPPYTNDPILAKYRFCNIFREFDKQTIEFHTLLNPLRNDMALWLLNMFYCRLVARPETIKFTGLLSFNQKENEDVYEKLMSSPRPRYGTPYVFPVSTIQKSGTPTRETFICRYLPSIMKKVANEIKTWNKESVSEGLEKIIPIFGYNLYFLWTEVLIDTAYQFPEHIDLFKRFPIGPGSKPTLIRIAPGTNLSQLAELASDLSRIPFETGITHEGNALSLSAENWEGIGCEFRKYTNLNAGKGRKRIFAV